MPSRSMQPGWASTHAVLLRPAKWSHSSGTAMPAGWSAGLMAAWIGRHAIAMCVTIRNCFSTERAR